jgi:hypothetical protein
VQDHLETFLAEAAAADPDADAQLGAVSFLPDGGLETQDAANLKSAATEPAAARVTTISPVQNPFW